MDGAPIYLMPVINKKYNIHGLGYYAACFHDRITTFKHIFVTLFISQFGLLDLNESLYLAIQTLSEL